MAHGKSNSRDDAATAFVQGLPYRNGTAIYTDGNTIHSYGPHYMIAESQLLPVSRRFMVGVNETDYYIESPRTGSKVKSMTTCQHVAAVKRALTNAGWNPTTETYAGMNGHTYRVWKVAKVT